MKRKFFLPGVVIILSIVILLPLSLNAEGDNELAGEWQGIIKLSGGELEVFLNFGIEDGRLKGYIDIPAQGAFGLKLLDFALEGKTVSFKIAGIPGDPTFNGKLMGGKIEGEFSQSGYTFPFWLEKKATKNRADENYATGKYKIEEKEVRIPVDGGHLTGTLTIPVGLKDKLPGVLLIAGSGPTDRDGNNPLIPARVDTLKEIAHYLSSRGIITLRYDKRGIGESSELIGTTTPPFSAYLDDVHKSTEFLKVQPEIDQDRIFIVGHSEGATLATMAAAERNYLKGIVLLAGPGFKHEDVYRKQVAAIGEAEENKGVYKDIKEEMLRALEDLFKAIKENKTFKMEDYRIPEKYRIIYLSLYNQKEFAREWLEVDPVNYLKKVDVPVCIIQGTNDGRVTKEDAGVLAEAVPPKRRELYILEGVNHFLKKAPTGAVSPEKRIDEKILVTIYNFITKQH